MNKTSSDYNNTKTNGVGQSTPVTSVKVPQQGATPTSKIMPAKATQTNPNGGI